MERKYKGYSEIMCNWCGESGQVKNGEKTMFTRVVFTRNGSTSTCDICAPCLAKHVGMEWIGADLLQTERCGWRVKPFTDLKLTDGLRKRSGATRSTIPTLEEVVEYGRELNWEELGAIPALRMIRDHFNLPHNMFADMLGVDPESLCRALAGTALLIGITIRCAELFGIDGGAGSNKKNNSKAKG